MVDLSGISDASLRDLLLKFDKDAPPVNATTRKTLEKKLREYCGGSTVHLSEEGHQISPNKVDIPIIATPSPMKNGDHSNYTSRSTTKITQHNVTPSQTPPAVRFIEKPDARYDYEREGTPSYCRKSLNEFRDNDWVTLKSDTPKYNVMDKPGCTPYTAKSLKTNPTGRTTNNGTGNRLKGVLLLALLVLVVGMGLYFLLNWDPSYHNPITA